MFRAVARQLSSCNLWSQPVSHNPAPTFTRFFGVLSSGRTLQASRFGNTNTLGRLPSALGSGAGSSAPGSNLPFSSWLPSISGAGALAAFSGMGLGGWLLVDLAINWGGWAVAAVLKTEKFYDLVGSASFLTLTAGSLFINGANSPRKILVSCMVGLWAARLGSYLVARVHKTGKDSRFDEVKHQPGMFLFYWTMQALWVWVTLTPVLIINTSPVAAPLMWADILGASVWAVGLGFEAVADAQKDAWRAQPENKGKFINQGLWAASRHPNYFGEMMIWWGVFMTCAGGFSQTAHYASVASPLFVMLLLRYVSGVPILERQADARWGGQPEYEAYKAKTPLLVPDMSRVFGGQSAP